MSPTSQRASAQASSADLNINKTRIAFMERASAPNIPPHAFKLAWLIAYRYMNRKTWTAYPPQERFARDLNVSVRTVQRLLDILEPLGLTIVPGDGRGYASTYAIDPERATRMSSFAARKGDKKGRQKAPKRVTPVSPQPIENQEESFVGELKLSHKGWRETIALRAMILPRSAAGRLTRPPIFSGTTRKGQRLKPRLCPWHQSGLPRGNVRRERRINYGTAPYRLARRCCTVQHHHHAAWQRLARLYRTVR